MIKDLDLALAWAKTKPSIRLDIKLDIVCAWEVLAIYPPGATSPRWCIWQTRKGGLQVDDLVKQEYRLPYTTVAAALRFIGSKL